VPLKPPPPPDPQPPQPEPAPQPSFMERPVTVIDVPSIAPDSLDKGPPIAPWNPPVIGGGPPLPTVNPTKAPPVRVAAIFRTPDSALRPPYPASKLRLEEEATLKLRLSIDTRGRVTAVEPVGAADPQFLAAARRHIIRAWRYKPATEDGAAVVSSTVITLSFRLEDG
jgi:periplasmic protein TonB